ncbi:hypothetical protein AVL59_05845 [Streptomyces griseochromogenes]|uniref:Uncharacterized protein n=1 Tax=Streptomyces griseochromogenes TaxID=68214 RepID=A0A1B1ARG2_9ACTN|nr:hypothetical protein AVL59_05845 [Streptomyces griseochromogenes]
MAVDSDGAHRIRFEYEVGDQQTGGPRAALERMGLVACDVVVVQTDVGQERAVVQVVEEPAQQLTDHREAGVAGTSKQVVHRLRQAAERLIAAEPATQLRVAMGRGHRALVIGQHPEAGTAQSRDRIVGPRALSPHAVPLEEIRELILGLPPRQEPGLAAAGASDGPQQHDRLEQGRASGRTVHLQLGDAVDEVVAEEGTFRHLFQHGETQAPEEAHGVRCPAGELPRRQWL